MRRRCPTFHGKWYVIDGVRKQPRQDRYLAISHIRYGEKNPGGVDGPDTIITVEEAIRMIEAGIQFARAPAGGPGEGIQPPQKVVIGISPQGNKYLRTGSDGLLGNHLLSLPAC